jgi:protoheme IX farnesyltransferase
MKGPVLMRCSDAAAAADVVGRNPAARRGRVADYLALAKYRLSGLVLVTTAVGYVVAAGGAMNWVRFTWTLLGTALAAGGANAWNQVFEVQRDARMRRTCDRPLPAKRLGAGEAAALAFGASVAGPLTLWWFVNEITALLGVLCIIVYVLAYTPLKTRSNLCTLVGAVCGAIPPMMGWSGATGELGAGAWLLGAVLFVWQIPHSLALAWLYRDDYRRGGFRILPVLDATGDATVSVILLYTFALVPLTLAATLFGLAGGVHALGAVLLGVGMIAPGCALYRRRTELNARRVFLASVIYLPLWLSLLLLDQPWGGPSIVLAGPVAGRAAGGS